MATILIAGGSLSGLLHAVFLRRDGHDVAVYERVAENMSSRGGGIATQAPLWQALENAGVLQPGAKRPGVALRERVVFDEDGKVIASRLHHQIVTSWDSLYRLLRPALPDRFYHQGREVMGLEEDDQGVTFLFGDGARERGDMVIAAMGRARPCGPSFCLDTSRPTPVMWHGAAWLPSLHLIRPRAMLSANA